MVHLPFRPFDKPCIFTTHYRVVNTLYEYNCNSMLPFGGDAKRENKLIRIQKKKNDPNYMQKLRTQNVHFKHFHVSHAYRWLLTSGIVKSDERNDFKKTWFSGNEWNFLLLIFQINAQNERVRVTIHWCASWWSPLTHAEQTQCAIYCALLSMYTKNQRKKNRNWFGKLKEWNSKFTTFVKKQAHWRQSLNPHWELKP